MIGQRVATALAVGLLAGTPACKQGRQATESSGGDIAFVAAPQLREVAPWIREQAAALAKQGKRSLVYVGASWCEPCNVFHAAVAAGTLNQTFPNLRLLEFDLDRDQDALTAAGYSSEMIPLFAEIAADGTASGRKIAGSVKGEAAVAQITPRLQALLAPAK